MISKTLLLLSAILCFSGAFGNRYLLYNQSINEAEYNITALRYKEALNTYKSVAKVDAMFAIDIHNALVCAILTKDEDAIKYFGNLLAEKGLPEKYFLEKTIFSSLKNKTYWKETARKSQKNYDSLLVKNKMTIGIIDSVINFDNKINNELAEKVKFYKGRHDTLKTYEKIRMDNSQYLATYFENNSFTGESVINYYLKNDTLLTLRPNFEGVIIHSYQGWYLSDTFFTPILNKALINRLIKPETFAMFQDYGNILGINARKYYGTSFMFVSEDNELYAHPYYYGDTLIRKEINNNRLNIGLIPLEKEIVKMKFYDAIGRDLEFLFLESYNTYIGYNVKDKHIKL